MSGRRPRLNAYWALFTLAIARSAGAQAAPDHARSGVYYAAHSATVGLLLVGSGMTQLALHPSEAGADFAWFPGDSSLRGVRSAAAARLSDQLVLLTVAAPVFTQLGEGVDAHFANFGIVYAEATSGSLLLNGMAKLAFRRPRPYTYGQDASRDADPNDRNVSFYSGHSSTAFVTAISGGLLFAESAPNRASKLVVWSSELMLAAATANLRVRAGKHYYSDIVVGGLVGAGLGILVPVLHGYRYRPRPAEYAAGGGGLLLGILVSQLLPLSIDAQGNRAGAWSFSPWATPLGVGASAGGSF